LKSPPFELPVDEKIVAEKYCGCSTFQMDKKLYTIKIKFGRIASRQEYNLIAWVQQTLGRSQD
jgi:hypothetical protein